MKKYTISLFVRAIFMMGVSSVLAKGHTESSIRLLQFIEATDPAVDRDEKEPRVDLKDILAQAEADEKNCVTQKSMGDIDHELECCRCCKFFSCCFSNKKVDNCTTFEYTLQRLLANADRNLQDRCQHAHDGISVLLQNYPCNMRSLFYASSSSSLRITALHAAAMLNDRDLMERVLNRRATSETQYNINARDSDGLTPLQRLIEDNNELLNKINERTRRSSCPDGLSPEHKTLNRRQLACIGLLLKYNANQDVDFTVNKRGSKRVIRAVDYAVSEDVKNLFRDAKKKK